jgi:hypothetical protein
MGTDKPRYLVKIKGCYYWRPTPRMQRAGFCGHVLGKNELHAKQEAIRLNADWDRHRFGERNQPNIMVYPPGSLGHAYSRAIALREAERKAKAIVRTRQQKARDDWPRAWRWIGPAFGDYDPLAVVVAKRHAHIEDRPAPERRRGLLLRSGAGQDWQGGRWHAVAMVRVNPQRVSLAARRRTARRRAHLLDARRNIDGQGGRPWPPRPYSSDRLGIDFRKIRSLLFGPNDERQIQDMRRSGAVEAVRGDATPMKLSAKMANTLSSSNRLHRTYVPVDVAAARDVDGARKRGRERIKSKKLQLQSAKKLQPE